MIRKNEKMYVLSGGKTEGHTCAECSHFYEKKWDKKYFKCELYGDSDGEGTDWRKHYTACAWFNQERKERNLVKIRLAEPRPEPEEEQLEGQMSIEDFLQEAE